MVRAKAGVGITNAKRRINRNSLRLINYIFSVIYKILEQFLFLQKPASCRSGKGQGLEVRLGRAI